MRPKVFAVVLAVLMLAMALPAMAQEAAVVSGNPVIVPFDINALPRASQPFGPDTCDIAIIVMVAKRTRSFHYGPGSIDCWFSPNPSGCEVAETIYEAIRAEFGDEWGGPVYSTADVGRIRKRQAEIAVQGTYSFLDIEDWGFWYAGSRIMTFPYLLPPCPPNYIGIGQKQLNASPVLPVQRK